MKQNNQTIKSLLAGILISSLLLVFTGCGDSSNSAEDKTTAKQKQEEPKELEEWEMTFPPEPPYDDKEFWSEPRIQFVWDREKTKNDHMPDDEIYSMKLDGSDIRLAASSEFISGSYGAGMTRIPVRSPNNRYIAMTMGGGNKHDLHKVIIDLKTKKRIIMAEGGAVPSFNWTPDSENVIFYLSHGEYRMVNFNIPTRTLTDLPLIESRGIYLLNDGKTFLATDKDGYRLHNFDGTLIEKVRIPGLEMTKRNYMSAGNKYLYFGYGRESYIFDITTKKIIFQTQNKHQTNYNCSTLLPYTNKLLYAGAWNEYFTQDIFDISKIEPFKLNTNIRLCWTQIINFKNGQNKSLLTK